MTLFNVKIDQPISRKRWYQLENRKKINVIRGNDYGNFYLRLVQV